MAKLRIGIVGCGDVAHRHYLPALAVLADEIELVGCSAARPETAERLAAATRGWSPRVKPFGRLADLLEETHPEAIFNLTPAPLHAAVSAECLQSGAHVYSEKPIAPSVAEADRLIEMASSRGLTLLCAPASAVTRRIRWLADVVASGRLGRPTLAVAQCANMGPAAWAEYTGDPTVFYGPGVGPVFDVGIYRLHELTTILGPVRRVQAMGTIAIPRRTVAAGPLAGRTIEVTTPDHALMNLEFAGGALGQLLSSFATPATLAPWLEVQLSEGSISLTGDPFGSDGPASFFGPGGWEHGVIGPPPEDPLPVIGMGARHFVNCVMGREKPVLTAEHARHVLEIVLAAYESIADGRSHELQTKF
jgi:predicted dehydrogenase